MMKARLVFVALLLLTLALPVFGKTYKSTYPVPCSELWGAVKDTLGNPENYSVVESNDTKMTASYNVKHTAHVTLTGVFTQRTNHVTLVSNGNVCEMQVVSHFSGWEHTDRSDFKKRVDEALSKLNNAPPSQPAKPEVPVK